MPSVYAKKTKKRQTIKLQDCTTWLALTNKVSYESQYGKLSNQCGPVAGGRELATSINASVPQPGGVKKLAFQEENMFTACQSRNVERINMLINRKTSRAIT